MNESQGPVYSTYLQDDPALVYHCAYCRQVIGLREEVQFAGDRYVYCRQDHVGKETISRYEDQWGMTVEPMYHCNGCGKFIGISKNIAGSDKHGRVYCSDRCYHAALDHPSYDMESRYGDY